MIWDKLLAGLPENTPISLKLRSSTVVSATEEEITVAMEREMDLDWIQADPKRHGHIAKQVKTISNVDYRVKFVAMKRKNGSAEPEAVKLPAEGQRLHDLAREVLGS